MGNITITSFTIGDEAHLEWTRVMEGKRRKTMSLSMCRIFFFSILTCFSFDDEFQIIMIITVGINFLYDCIVTI